MSARDRTFVSLFLVWQLVAMGISAVPDPASLAAVAGQARPADDAISIRLRPVVEFVSAGVLYASGVLYRSVGFLRPVVSPYINRLGLNQSWNMFANPPLVSEYLRMRYYVRPHAGGSNPITVATELVFPAAPESQSRLLRAFWQSHQDKAVSNAFGTFITERARRRREPDAPVSSRSDEALRQSLLPVVQYFTERYAATHLEQDGSRPAVLRTEAWYGATVSRAPDESDPFTRSHAAALSRYYSAASSQPAQAPWPGLDTTEHDADIVWTLIFIQAP